MVKKKLWFGMLVLLLVFGMAMVGCDDGSDDGGSTFTVSYDVGAGSGSAPSSQTVSSGQTIYLPGQGSMSPPSGQTFNGWRAGDVNYSVGDSYTVYANVTFIAQWQTSGGSGTTYTITFNANGGSVSPSSGTTGTNGRLTTLPTPTRSGYTFNGWFTSTSGGTQVTTSTVFTQNSTIYAQWTSSSGGGTLPSAPTGVSATRQSSSNVYITWNAVSGATSYRVYWSYTATGTYNFAGTTTSTNYTDSGWGATESGYIKVSAVNSAGEGPQSAYASFPAFSSGVSVPSAPTGVSAVRNSTTPTTVNITWNSVSGATSYRVYYSTTGTGSGTLDGTSTTTSYTSTGNTATSTWYFRVSAVNSAGEGSPSSWVSVGPVSGGGGTWPPTVAETFNGSGTASNPQVFDGTLSSTSSVLWYRINWPLSYSEITIMGLDRQSGYGHTADIVASFYGSTGTLLEGPVNLGGFATIDRAVSSLSTYYIKVEVNPSSPYTGTFRIGLLER